MADWTHAICDECWEKRNPNRTPVRMNPGFSTNETCCFCGKKTTSGIFVRFNPESSEVICKGVHSE